MSKYRQFIFDSYEMSGKELSLHYLMDNKLHFTEVYKFNFDFADHDAQVLDRAIQTLFFIAGVSYFKAYLPNEIMVNTGQVDTALAAFLAEVYQKGLGEFFYVNKMDPRTSFNFPVNSPAISPIEIEPRPSGLLVGLGGGKDSLVTVELLRGQDVMTWSLNHRPQLTPLVQKIGLPHAWVERTIDPQIINLNDSDAYNGHVPISAIFAATGTVVNILTGRRDNIVSNESSASEPNLHYQGVAINHQYSKSLEFEKLYQKHLAANFGDSLRYYSLLRPFTELRIAEIFSQIGFKKYKDVFSSCNRAYTLTSNHMSWCGHCPKCAFVFLALTPFLPRPEVESLWGGQNLLLSESLEPMFKQLLGVEGDKPLDCVGEVKESRAAMRLAQKIYPELDKYKFELPKDYDFRMVSTHAMPDGVWQALQPAIRNY